MPEHSQHNQPPALDYHPPTGASQPSRTTMLTRIVAAVAAAILFIIAIGLGFYSILAHSTYAYRPAAMAAGLGAVVCLYIAVKKDNGDS